jgi:hypothetical protein
MGNGAKAGKTKLKKPVKKAPGVQKQGSKLVNVVVKKTKVVKVICNTCKTRQVFVYKGEDYQHCLQCLCKGKMKSDPRKPCKNPIRNIESFARIATTNVTDDEWPRLAVKRHCQVTQ